VPTIIVRSTDFKVSNSGAVQLPLQAVEGVNASLLLQGSQVVQGWIAHRILKGTERIFRCLSASRACLISHAEFLSSFFK
jgi:hypothetical protein